MKYALAPVAFGLGAHALVPRDAPQCVQLKASGGASGTLGQYTDGQNRIGGGYPPACYCLSNGGFTDSSGRGCILTNPTTQWQCDSGASPTTGFAIGSNGGVTYNGSGTFYACPYNDQGGYNIYSQPAPNQSKCVQITLSSAGSCGQSAQSSAPPAKSSAPPAQISCPPPSTMTMTAPAPPPVTVTAQMTCPAPKTYSSTVTMTAPAPPPVTVTAQMTCPAPKTYTSTVTMTAAAPPPVTVTAKNTCPAPVTMPPTTVTMTAAAPPPVTVTAKNTCPAPVTMPPTTVTVTAPSNNTPVPSPQPSKPAQPSGSCPADLNGNYQYPHLIVPVSSSSPNQAYGTSYNGKVDKTTCSIFNFDIPSSYSGKKCTVIFLFPLQKDLQTSSYTTSGSGSCSFSQLSSPATQSTSWSNAPSKMMDLGSMSIAPGNSYTIASGDCAAGQTVSYEMCSSGDYSLNYFQDYNPSPIGMYVRSC